MVVELVQHFSLTTSLGSPEGSWSPRWGLWSWENGSSHWVLLPYSFHWGVLWCDCNLLELPNVGLCPGLTGIYCLNIPKYRFPEYRRKVIGEECHSCILQVKNLGSDIWDFQKCIIRAETHIQISWHPSLYVSLPIEDQHEIESFQRLWTQQGKLQKVFCVVWLEEEYTMLQESWNMETGCWPLCAEELSFRILKLEGLVGLRSCRNSTANQHWRWVSVQMLHVPICFILASSAK